jgi:hypothetical protein
MKRVNAFLGFNEQGGLKADFQDNPPSFFRNYFQNHSKGLKNIRENP